MPATHLTLRRAGLDVPGAAGLSELRASFAATECIVLPGFLSADLLTVVQDKVAAGTFVERRHGHIGNESSLAPGHATGLLELLINDTLLFDTVNTITGCGPIGCFEGRVYRMLPQVGHFDSWHGDIGEGRLIAMSVNLSPAPYAGGLLQLARVDRPSELLAEVANTGPGDALLFRIAPTLQHRVTAVAGSLPKTAYAGWYRSYPVFEDIWRAARTGM